jgi:hypothetical protein
MLKTTRVSIFLMVGLLILGMGIFAGQFGLDPDPGWGKGRIALVILGLLVASVPWTLNRYSAAHHTVQSDLFALPALLVVVGVYFWFITVSHDFTSNYYSLLATAFRSGELHLPLNPDPALLQLPNPYDPAAREGIKVPQDLSLYNGKFYLYWGPAPSALLALVQPFLPGRLGEVDLLFLFMSGIFLAEYLLLMHLWERFFPELPKWMVILSIFLAGFANPALWMLSQPKIYEAAIAGAQFFFITGFAAAVLALDRQPVSRPGLALAGTMWALAVGTRSVAVFPVVFMAGMVVYRLFQLHRRSLLRFVGELLPLGLTLFAGAVGFAWYNWIRFGSLLETGFTYQLAAPYLQKHMDELFLPDYIFQNLYNYLFNPFVIQQSFPFLYPVRGRIEEILPGQTLPELYTAQAVTGFLYGVPFLIFAIVPVTLVAKQLLRKHPRVASSQDPQALSLNWIVISLFGSFLMPFLSLLAFFWAAMRYTEDFLPALVLLSILGFWQVYQRQSQMVIKSKIYVPLGVVLAGWSILSAVLLALSIYYTSGLL